LKEEKQITSVFRSSPTTTETSKLLQTIQIQISAELKSFLNIRELRKSMKFVQNQAISWNLKTKI